MTRFRMWTARALLTLAIYVDGELCDLWAEHREGRRVNV